MFSVFTQPKPGGPSAFLSKETYIDYDAKLTGKHATFTMLPPLTWTDSNFPAITLAHPNTHVAFVKLSVGSGCATPLLSVPVPSSDQAQYIFQMTPRMDIKAVATAVYRSFNSLPFVNEHVAPAKAASCNHITTTLQAVTARASSLPLCSVSSSASTFSSVAHVVNATTSSECLLNQGLNDHILVSSSTTAKQSIRNNNDIPVVTTGSIQHLAFIDSAVVPKTSVSTLLASVGVLVRGPKDPGTVDKSSNPTTSTPPVVVPIIAGLSGAFVVGGQTLALGGMLLSVARHHYSLQAALLSSSTGRLRPWQP